MNVFFDRFKYLIFIAMIYITIDLTSMVFAYKIITIASIIGAASSLVFPLTYALMDVIAEVYGFKTARTILIFSILCDFIFTTSTLLISQIPSNTQSETNAYIQVFGQLVRATFAQMIGVLTGAIINIYLISKWKILTNGRYFWLRSICSSAIGEGIMLIVSVLIALTGVLSFDKILHLITYAYLYKIIFAIAISPFISITVALLKRKPNDFNINELNIPRNAEFYPNFQTQSHLM